jgi:diguanylate cyclase (GGDEF)-like protein
MRPKRPKLRPFWSLISIASNQSLGRTIGGGLLGSVADRIRSALGSSDIAARLGGDKFGIIQAGQGQPQSAAALAERFVDLIGRSYIVEGHLIDVAASVGIVLLPTEATDCEQLLNNADLALHRAKSDGLGAYRFFERAMDEKMQYRRNLEIDLRRALALGELSLVYQPQVDLRQNKVTGFEALLRWQSPIRGAVSPLEFIPIAEETGIITPIGERVLRTACLEAASWSGAQKVPSMFRRSSSRAQISSRRSRRRSAKAASIRSVWNSRLPKA